MQAPPEVLYQSLEGSTRSLDEAKRRATFVAATETGVRSPWGPEWLRMSGVNLRRFQRNPVILDTHNRYNNSSIIGRAASVKVEGRELIVDVEFAPTERGDEAWGLVKGGFLRAVSVGFMPTKYRELDKGEFDGEGESRVEGPGVVIHEWELLEVSTVPIPADENALLRRSFFSPAPNNRRAPMSEPTKSIYAEGAGNDKPAPETRTVATPPAIVTQPAPASTAMGNLKREILEIAPSDLRSFAEGLVLQDGMDFAKAKAALRAEWEKRNAPVGTPSAPTPEKKNTGPEVTDEVLLRSLKNVRS